MAKSEQVRSDVRVPARFVQAANDPPAEFMAHVAVRSRARERVGAIVGVGAMVRCTDLSGQSHAIALGVLGRLMRHHRLVGRRLASLGR